MRSPVWPWSATGNSAPEGCGDHGRMDSCGRGLHLAGRRRHPDMGELVMSWWLWILVGVGCYGWFLVTFWLCRHVPRRGPRHPPGVTPMVSYTPDPTAVDEED